MPNQLFYGDNLEVLRHKIKDESVDLVYIDPPFNSQRNYFQIYNNIGGEDRAQAQAFVDTWTWDDIAREGYAQIMDNQGGVCPTQTIELLRGLRAVLGEGALLAYIVSMTLRVAQIHRVLKPTGSFYLHCFPGTTRVRLADGRHVPICAVAPGDRVTTEAGEDGEVANCLHRHFKGDLVSLSISGVPEPLQCTPEHQIFVLPRLAALRLRRMWMRDGRLQRGVSRWKTRRPRVDSDYYAAQARKVAAGDIERGDYCLLPIDRRVEAGEALWLEVPRNPHHLATPLPARVCLDAELAEICGLYLAEGGISTNGYCVHWTFHQREADMARRLQELLCRVFGAPSHIADLKGVKAIRLTASSVALAGFFHQHFGCGSRDKTLPLAAQRAPLEIQRALFAAWARRRLCPQRRLFARHHRFLRPGIRDALCVWAPSPPLEIVRIRPDDHAQTAYRVQINAADAEKIGFAPVAVPDAPRLRRAFIPMIGSVCRCAKSRRSLRDLEPRHAPGASLQLPQRPYLKLVLDSVFVTQGGDFKNEIIWKRTHSHGGAKRYGPVHDVILFYSKSGDYVWNPQHTEYSEEYLEKFFRFQDDDGRRYCSTILTGSGVRGGSSGKEWRGYNPTSVGRHGQFPALCARLLAKPKPFKKHWTNSTPSAEFCGPKTAMFRDSSSIWKIYPALVCKTF